MTTHNDDSSEITPQAMMALRKEADALRIIIGRLHVKDMGPADYIRTKHEVKAFLESGAHNLSTGEDIIRRARIRVEENRQHVQTLMLNQQQRVTQKQTNGNHS